MFNVITLHRRFSIFVYYYFVRMSLKSILRLYYLNTSLTWTKERFKKQDVYIITWIYLRYNYIYLYKLVVSVKHDGWRPKHRGWSTWHDHSRCSASCGGGVRTRARKCHGGRDSDDYRHCGGAAYRTEPCNTHPCPGTI